MEGLFVNTDKQEKRKPLQRSHYNETIAKRYRFFLYSIFLTRIYEFKRITFFFGIFLEYTDNKYISNGLFFRNWDHKKSYGFINVKDKWTILNCATKTSQNDAKRTKSNQRCYKKPKK